MPWIPSKKSLEEMTTEKLKSKIGQEAELRGMALRDRDIKAAEGHHKAELLYREEYRNRL